MGFAMSTVKYILFIFNLLCALVGIAIIALGAVYLTNVKSFSDFVDTVKAVNLPIAVIILGCLICIIAFFGCCGAIRESHCMTITYSVFLFVLLVLQIVAVVMLFLSKDVIVDEIEKGVQKIFDKAQNDPESMNLIQSSFQCCGVKSYSDYFQRVPPSCCPGQQCINNNYFQNGCRETVGKNVNKLMNILVWVGVGVFGIELVGFIFACCLATHIRNHKRRSTY